MEAWITDHKLPLGAWAKAGIDWINANFAGLFDLVSLSLGAVLERFWSRRCSGSTRSPSSCSSRRLPCGCKRSFLLTAGVALSLLLVLNLGYWQETIETLALIVTATVLCMAIGVPLGIAAAHRPWLYATLRPILDLMQTIPTFVYLIPTLILFGLGMVPGLISTVIFALPAPIRLTYLGIASAPANLKEAVIAFGATERQLLWKVELPHAWPTIMAGLTQCIMLSLSMVVIAALVGAGGLGQPVVRALNTVNIAAGVEAGLAIVVLAILLDRLCKAPRRRG